MVAMSLLPFVALGVIAATALWVYTDSQRLDVAGRPVVVSIGWFVIDSPVAWTAGCVIVWVIAFPLYLVARGGRGLVTATGTARHGNG